MIHTTTVTNEDAQDYVNTFANFAYIADPENNSTDRLLLDAAKHAISAGRERRRRDDDIRSLLGTSLGCECGCDCQTTSQCECTE